MVKWVVVSLSSLATLLDNQLAAASVLPRQMDNVPRGAKSDAEHQTIEETSAAGTSMIPGCRKPYPVFEMQDQFERDEA